MTDTKQAVEMPEEIWANVPDNKCGVYATVDLIPPLTKYIRADLAETVPTVVTVDELWNWFENERGDIYKLKNRYPNGLKIVDNK